MSSMTMFARGDHAVILTDTASTTVEDGRFVVNSFVNKIVVFPHSKMAITLQGASEALMLVATYLQFGYNDLDGVVERSAALLEELHDKYLMRWSDNAAAPEFIFGVIGWSKKNHRFEAHMATSSGRGRLNCDELMPEQREPFQFYRRDLVLSPMLHQSDFLALGIPQNGAMFASNAREYLLRFMKTQRHVAAEDGKGYCIGGEVVATEFTLEGVTQRVIHRWNDKIGEPIVPGALPTLPPNAQPAGSAGASAAGMTRQQRRAAEAQARKQRHTA